MKIRNSFVSNSSSSSFIIFGKQVQLEDITPNNLDKIYVEGTYLSEGMDVFKLDKEMLGLLNISENSPKPSLKFIEAYKTIYADCFYVGEPDTEVVNDLPPKFNIYSYDRDHHSTQDSNIFLDRYLSRL